MICGPHFTLMMRLVCGNEFDIVSLLPKIRAIHLHLLLGMNDEFMRYSTNFHLARLCAISVENNPLCADVGLQCKLTESSLSS